MNLFLPIPVPGLFAQIEHHLFLCCFIHWIGSFGPCNAHILALSSQRSSLLLVLAVHLWGTLMDPSPCVALGDLSHTAHPHSRTRWCETLGVNILVPTGWAASRRWPKCNPRITQMWYVSLKTATVVHPYPWGLHFKTSRGCLQPWIAPNPG